MKRRDICRYIMLGLASFTGIVSSKSYAIFPKSLPYKLSHNWVVLYWMPYDNNLAVFGEQIIEMLRIGTKNSEAAVIVQSDYFGESKMRRCKLIKGVIEEIEIVGEDSSNVSAFSTYIDWVYQNFDAKHWAIIVVGHGGKLNEVSPDDHGASNQNRTWMRVDKFAHVVSRFNQTTNGKVELLFFQNCNKGTLEVVYEARNCARYTLTSQMTLGAPNYYYEGFLKRLNKSLLNGHEAAIAIIESERADMYHTLTLVENQAVRYIPNKLSRLIQTLLTNDLQAIDLSKLSTIRYSGEQCCDVLTLFEYLSKNINQAGNAFTEFADFLKSSVIVHYQTGGQFYSRRRLKNNDAEKLSGLSLYLPENRQAISQYSSLALYQKIDLVSLYKEIIHS